MLKCPFILQPTNTQSLSAGPEHSSGGDQCVTLALCCLTGPWCVAKEPPFSLAPYLCSPFHSSQAELDVYLNSVSCY